MFKKSAKKSEPKQQLVIEAKPMTKEERDDFKKNWDNRHVGEMVVAPAPIPFLAKPKPKGRGRAVRDGSRKSGRKRGR
jgi:hypothetical protein